MKARVCGEKDQKENQLQMTEEEKKLWNDCE